jgi:hypothetical protein
MLINPYISFPTGGVLPPQGVTVDIYTAGTDFGDQTSAQNSATSLFNDYYRWSCCHVFIQASEINQLVSGGKTITGFEHQAFNSTNNRTLSNWRISVAHTNELTLSTLMETDISQSGQFTYFDRQICYDGTVFGINGGWNTVNFTNNFIYNGTSALVFSFENRRGSYSTSASRYRTIYGSRNLSFRASLFQDDGDNITTGSYPMITTGITTANGNFPNLKINY